MEAVAPPEELFERDVHTMPAADPAALKRMMEDAKKQLAEDEKAAVIPKGVKAAAKTKVAVSTDEKKMESTVRQIRLYFAKLPHKISIKEPKSYPKTLAGAQELLWQIQAELRSNGGIEKAAAAYGVACQAIERMTDFINPLGWELHGPAASFSETVLLNQKQWQDLVTEFAIENHEWMCVGPGKRLIATTVQLIFAVDRANKQALAGRSAPTEEMMAAAENLKEKEEAD